MLNYPQGAGLVSTKKRIEATAEFQRVDALPWFDWHAHVTHNDGYLRLSTALKTPYGQQVLRPIQAAALTYLHDFGGAFCPIPVGFGKTLITFLAARVVNAQRPALFIPAGLREKTWREFQKLYQHWFGPTVFMRRKDFDEVVFNYEELSRENGQRRLFEYKPDLVCADEASALKNRTSAACTQIVEQFMYQHYDTKFVALTGTPTMRSPMDFWHIMFWCLRHHMPMPRNPTEAELWALSVRESKEILVNRPSTAIFYRWLPKDAAQKVVQENNLEYDTHLARIAFGRRFASAPGVVAAPESSESVGASLQLRRLFWDPGPQARRWIAHLRATKKTPNGVELQLPMELWRVERQLASGFWYRWDPLPPEEWLQKRKTWGWYIRNICMRDGILYSMYMNLELFSPGRLANAIVQGRLTDAAVCKAYQQWVDIKDTYEHDTIDEWIDDGVLNKAAQWLQKERGIAWTEHKAFGRKLAKLFGTGFCSRDGLDDQGVLIDDYAGRPVVASVQANHKGRNLQAWNKNLGVTVPPNGALVEQLIGRTHRPGQMADAVYFDFVEACDAQAEGFSQILYDARYIEDSTTQRQKLNYADKVW